MSRLLPHTAGRAVLLASLLGLPLLACNGKNDTADGGATATDGSTKGDSSVPPLGGFGGSGSGGSGGAPTGSPDGGGATPDGGGSNQPPPATPDPMAIKTCTDLQSDFCTKLMGCAPGFLKEEYGDVATCQKLAATECSTQPAVPGSGATPAGRATCLAAIMAQSCTDFFNNADLPACDYKGTRTIGASCVANEQCASGHCAPGTGCGVCSTAAGVGAKCGSTSDCAPGLQCSTVCFVPAKAGEACTANTACGLGLYCSGGKCNAEVAMAGAACEFSADFNSCSLANDLLCDQTTSKCIARTYVAKGGVCNGGSIGCQPMGGCYGPANAATGMCQDRPKEGEACTPDPNNEECARPFRCIQNSATTGVCGIPQFVDPAVCN